MVQYSYVRKYCSFQKGVGMVLEAWDFSIHLDLVPVTIN